MPSLADHKMIVNLDAERLGRVDDLARHLNIRVGGRRVAGGVVVEEPFSSRYPFEK